MKIHLFTSQPWCRAVGILCVSMYFTACSGESYSSPNGYDLAKPEVVQLGKALNEISGLAFTTDGPSLITISDSKEKIIEIGLRNKKLKDIKEHIVGPDSDLEDIVLMDTAYYLLSSWGEIKEVPKDVNDSSEIQKFDLGLQGQNDFESMYYDPTASGLVIICKTCAHERGKKVRTAFRFDLATKSFDTSAFFFINKEDVENLVKETDIQVDPSAAAIHPLDKRLYILSSSSQLLIITDTRGKVMEVYRLNPDLFPQAEGIAFAPNGDMYISNEGKFGKPTLLVFRYGKSSAKNKQ